jgi:long-chain acyl-CoA synthetase
VRERPSKVAVGWRDVVKVHEEVKEVTKTVGGKETTETKTYGELGEKIKNAASGLIETGHSRDTIFNVYSQTSVNWQIMAQGAFPSLLSSPSLCSLHSFHAY